MKLKWRTLLNPIVGAVTFERASAGLTTIKPMVHEEGAQRTPPGSLAGSLPTQVCKAENKSKQTSEAASGPGAAPAMMFPSLIAPPAVYPSLLRPTPTLTLPQSLQSAFSSHSSFLVEDLIRISRPSSYLPRSAPPPSMSPPSSAARTDSGTPELPSSATAGSRRICSPQTSSGDSTFLKFGVNAILSSTPRAGKRGQPECRQGWGQHAGRGWRPGEAQGPALGDGGGSRCRAAEPSGIIARLSRARGSAAGAGTDGRSRRRERSQSRGVPEPGRVFWLSLSSLSVFSLVPSKFGLIPLFFCLQTERQNPASPSVECNRRLPSDN